MAKIALDHLQEPLPDLRRELIAATNQLVNAHDTVNVIEFQISLTDVIAQLQDTIQSLVALNTLAIRLSRKTWPA